MKSSAELTFEFELTSNMGLLKIDRLLKKL
jgi:hypothetical protein